MAALVLVAAPIVLPINAHATDLDFASSSNAGSRFVRIGLNKSVVIKLPANARDVLVGNPDIVDAVIRTKNTAYLFARAVGQTNVFFFDEQWTPDPGPRPRSRAGHGGASEPHPPDHTGLADHRRHDRRQRRARRQAANPAEAKTAIDLATKFTGDEKKVMSTIAVTGKEQVMLRVRVAEVQRTVLKQFGINWQAMFDIGKFAFNLASINPFSAGQGPA